MPAWIILVSMLSAVSAIALVAGARLKFQRRSSSWNQPCDSSSGNTETKLKRQFFWALAFFVCFAIYGSLVPFDWVQLDGAAALRQITTVLTQPLSFESRSDWATNVLLFVPIGF